MGKMPRIFAAGVMVLAWLAATGGPCRASVIDTSPQMIDGWTISWPTTIQLSVSQDGTNSAQVDLVKSATFTAPQQGFQISFAPTPGKSQTADLFDLIGESITNDTGEVFGDFSFILLNTGTAPATLTNVFALPSGTGYHYTSESTISNNTEADYTGTQNNGVTSSWGGTTSSDKLVISAPSGSSFVLKELSEPQIPIIPEPGALGLLLFGTIIMLKRRVRDIGFAKAFTSLRAFC